MGATVVEVSAPSRHQIAGMAEVVEQVLIQTFICHAPVDALHNASPDRLAGVRYKACPPSGLRAISEWRCWSDRCHYSTRPRMDTHASQRSDSVHGRHFVHRSHRFCHAVFDPVCPVRSQLASLQACRSVPPSKSITKRTIQRKSTGTSERNSSERHTAEIAMKTWRKRISR